MNNILGIVGVGHVGQNVAYTSALKGIAREILLVDKDKAKAKSQCYDLNDAMSFYNSDLKIRTCDYEDLSVCDVIVISVGTILATKNRLSELKESVEIVSSFVPRIMSSGFKGKFIVVTNPCDIVAYKVMSLSNLPKNHIISSGTSLDSARLKTILSSKLNISTKSISAYILGEHGDSQFVSWSNTDIFGKNIDKYLEENPDIKDNFDKNEIQNLVRDRGWEVYVGKKSTEFGIANTVSSIVQSIFFDEKKIHLVASYIDGQYNLSDIFISTPCIIGKDGIEKILEVDMTKDEQDSFDKTVKIIIENIDKIR